MTSENVVLSVVLSKLVWSLKSFWKDFQGGKKYGLKRNEMKTEIEIYSSAFRFMKYFKKC